MSAPRPIYPKYSGTSVAKRPVGSGTTDIAPPTSVPRPMYQTYSGTSVEEAALPTVPVWAVVASLAERQHGVVARHQIRSLDVPNHRIDHQLRTGHLHSVQNGVFAVGHRRLSATGRWMAAVLACGNEAVLGYRSAAALWEIRPSSAPGTEVIVRRRGPACHNGVIAHRHPGIAADERAVRDGIPTTSIARTLLDLSAVVSRTQVRRAIGQAEVLKLFDLYEILPLLQRHPRHRGARPLREILRTWTELPRTRSAPEEAFPGLCVRHGLPRPVMNSTVAGMEVDALFPDHGVAVELDSRRFHAGLTHWEADHEKRARLAAEGWMLLAFTYRQQTDNDGSFVIETLGPALRRHANRRPKDV